MSSSGSVKRGGMGIDVERDMVPLLFDNSNSTREDRKEEQDEG